MATIELRFKDGRIERVKIAHEPKKTEIARDLRTGVDAVFRRVPPLISGEHPLIYTEDADLKS